MTVFSQERDVETNVSLFEENLGRFAFEMEFVFVRLDSEYFLSENGFVMDPSFFSVMSIFYNLFRNSILVLFWFQWVILGNIFKLLVVLIDNVI